MGGTKGWTLGGAAWVAMVLAACVGAAAGAQGPAASQPAADLTSLSLEDLMNVEVTTVSRQKQSVSEAPAAVTVITQEDIQRSGLTTIPDLLRLVPGMDVARFNANTWAISARGFNDVFSNKLLVLVDGRSVYTSGFGGVFWDQQDYLLQDLDRIEVVRGPGATLWGSNAVNGVVNIVSKSARDTQGWLLTGMLGTEHQNAGARFGGKIDDKTYFRVFTTYRDFDNQETATAQSAHDGWQSLHGGFRVDRYSTPEDTLTFEGDLYGQEIRLNEKEPVSVPPFLLFPHGTYNDDTGSLLGRWSHKFSDTSNLALQTYYQRLDNYDFFAPYKEDTFDIDFQHRFSLGRRQELIWGLGYRLTLNRFDARNGFVFSPSNRTMEVASGFVQDDITLVPDRLHLILGTKLEYDTYANFQAQPSGRIMWTPDRKHSVWAAVSRAITTPTRYEEDATTPFTTVTTPQGTIVAGTVGNQDLKPEELIAYEAGYRFKPTQALSFDLAGFYNVYNNLIGTQTLIPTIADTPPPPHLFLPLQWRNNLDGHSYGGEIAANWHVTDNWRLVAWYSLLDITINSSASGSNLRRPYFEGASPQQQFQIRSYYNLSRNLQLNVAGYYVSSLAVGHIPAYFSVDANVAWQVNDRMQLMFGVQNLFDDRRPEFPDSQTFTVASQVQRNFFVDLTYRF